MNTNPFLPSSSSRSNPFTSNIYPNKSNDFFKTNFNQTSSNSFNPFKPNNNTSNNNGITNSPFNNNDAFSKIKTNFSDNMNNTNIFNNNNNISSNNPFMKNNNNTNFNSFSKSNNNFFNNNSNNPFNTNNNNNTFNNNSNPFSNNNNTFNNTFSKNNNNTFNDTNINNFSFRNENIKIYNFINGITTRLPICPTVGKNPITTFNNNIRFQRDYPEKNKINSMDYTSARQENIINDENLKNFSLEEIRKNDYLNAKIDFFDKWNNNAYNFNDDNNMNNQNNNMFLNNNSNNIFLNNNNGGNNNNAFSIFNQNNKSTFLNSFNNNNNNGNPFINNNNNNNNNIFNANNNSFNNNTNNNKNNFISNNSTISMFNNNSTNPFNNSSNTNIFNNNSNNIFNNNNNGSNFTFNNTSSNNNIFNKQANNTNNFLNNNFTSNIFNKNNNIFNNNTNNIFNNNNNNNIFNNNNQNPFNSILNNNNNINNSTNYFFNNSINNNNNNILANNIFNNNANNFLEKPFEEKIKDQTWVKRNVKIIENNDSGKWYSDYVDDIEKVNLKINEIIYFNNKEGKEINSNEIMSEPQSIYFNKIKMYSNEEILNNNKNKKKIIVPEYNELDYQNNITKNKNNKWDPIHIQNNKSDIISITNQDFENSLMNQKYNINNNNTTLNNYEMKKTKLSGFAEASQILSNLDNNFVDFNYNIKARKEYVLPTEKPDFKFNNTISNRQSYVSHSINNNMYNDKIIENNFDEEKNNYNVLNLEMDFDNNNNNQQSNLNLINNGFNTQNLEKNIIENKESIHKENANKNNLINTNSNKTTKINSDEINRNLVIIEENTSNEKNNDINIYENECKLIFIGGELKSLQELQIPILIPFSSLILNPENILNFDLILDIIIKNILTIENIENKIILPQKEDIFLKINGKIYSKLTNTEISINEVEKYNDEKNIYFYIFYGVKLKQYPILEPDINDPENKYITKPTIEEMLNPGNNYDLKNINNFEIWNKYGKVIFIDPIDLSGKMVINDVIKINEGEIDLSNKRVDKLKARAFLYYDFGDKLEGTFLENIKYILKNNNGNFIKYEKKILEYTINF